jgi:hypothetical protein
LIRAADGSQASFYSVTDPAQSVLGVFGMASDVSRDTVAVLALELATIILADEQSRRDLPKWTHPTVESRPYG